MLVEATTFGTINIKSSIFRTITIMCGIRTKKASNSMQQQYIRLKCVHSMVGPLLMMGFALVVR